MQHKMNVILPSVQMVKMSLHEVLQPASTEIVHDFPYPSCFVPTGFRQTNSEQNSFKLESMNAYKSTKFTCMCQLQKGLFTFLCSFRRSYQGKIILEATFKLLYFTCGICHLFCEGEDHDCFTFADLYIGNLYMYNLVRLPHPQNCSVNFWHK